MAINTRDRRMSFVGFARQPRRIMPNPDGSIGKPDRAMLLWLYPGLAVGGNIPVYDANVAIRLTATANVEL